MKSTSKLQLSIFALSSAIIIAVLAYFSFAVNRTDANNATSNTTFQLGRPSGTLTNHTQDYAGASLPEDNSLVGHWKLDTVNGTSFDGVSL